MYSGHQNYLREQLQQIAHIPLLICFLSPSPIVGFEFLVAIAVADYKKGWRGDKVLAVAKKIWYWGKDWESAAVLSHLQNLSNSSFLVLGMDMSDLLEHRSKIAKAAVYQAKIWHPTKCSPKLVKAPTFGLPSLGTHWHQAKHTDS